MKSLVHAIFLVSMTIYARHLDVTPTMVTASNAGLLPISFGLCCTHPDIAALPLMVLLVLAEVDWKEALEVGEVFQCHEDQ